MFLLLLFISVIGVLRVSLLSSYSRQNIVNYFTSLLLSVYTCFAILAISFLYYLLDNYSSLELSFSSVPGHTAYISYIPTNFLIEQAPLNLHLVSIYCFPFIYIFVLITVLSILFCLAYNLNELNTFFAYCTLILAAGYILFFTSSLLVFFFAYEMLLIPSFFILYNFAKTRKCVEASYLMFF